MLISIIEVHVFQRVESLVAFELDGVRWALEPKTAFYDHLYLTALMQNPDLADQVMFYDAFTDIEFNPNRQINCQAAAAALYVSLRKQGRLEEAMSSQENFLKIHP